MKTIYNTLEHAAQLYEEHDVDGALPDTTESSTSNRRLDQIMADPLLDKIPAAERHEVMSTTFELYQTTKETLAPVVASFANELLTEAGNGGR